MAFTGPAQLSTQDVYKTSTTKLMPLGTQGMTRDGRLFRYLLAGGTALAAGKLNTAAAAVANHQNVLVQSAAAVYDQTLAVTLGATATTASQYDDGYVVGYDVAGQGQTLRIAGTPVVAASGVAVFNLGDPIAVALPTTARVNLEQNPWSNATVAATTGGLFANGVANVAIPAANYGWVQTRGTAAVLGNGTITIGTGLVASATTAGAVDGEAATVTTQRVGLAAQAGATTKYNTVYLSID